LHSQLCFGRQTGAREVGSFEKGTNLLPAAWIAMSWVRPVSNIRARYANLG
jgi:hypothetical protein